MNRSIPTFDRSSSSSSARSVVASAPSIRRLLLSRLRDARLARFEEQALPESKMRAVLTSAFEHRRSAAVVVTGPCLQRSVQLVDKVLGQFRDESSERNSQDQHARQGMSSASSSSTPPSLFTVARVRGLAGGAGADERHALLELARGLGVVLQSNNMTVSLEALHEYFKHGQMSSVPTVLLLESFEEFAKKSRQVLLYTLLDLMHRRDLLFVIVGVTESADITTQLEKRVISRLNAQFIEVSTPTIREVCKELCTRLSLEPDADNDGASDDAISKRRRVAHDDGSDGATNHMPADFCAAFNSGVQFAFLDRASASNTGSAEIVSTTPVGKAIGRHLAWGDRMSSFIRAAEAAVLQLTDSAPYITSELILSCLQDTDHDAVPSMLEALSKVELWTFAIALRLYYRCKKVATEDGNSAAAKKRAAALAASATTAFVGPSGAIGLGLTTGAGTGGDIPLVSFAVGTLKIEVEKLLRSMGMQLFSARDLSAAVHALSDLGLLRLFSGSIMSSVGGEGIYSDETAVLLGVSPIEARACFELRATSSAAASSSSSVAGRAGLRMPDRVRRAVLEPLEPLFENVAAGTDRSIDLME